MILDKTTLWVVVLAALALASCSRGPASLPKPVVQPQAPLVSNTNELPIVVATTSTLGALVSSVGGNFITVRVLVPIGASPETYEPAPRDVVALTHAVLIVENGAGLETWLAKLIASSSSNAPVVSLSDAIACTGTKRTSLRAPEPHHVPLDLKPQAMATPGCPSVNPHFWLDPAYAQVYVAEIARALAQVDPANASRYQANAAAQIRRLGELDRWTKGRIATIPPDRRAMIAFHDAWYYFDARYGIRDVGAIEPSPGREPSAAELAALIATAKANHVRAIFAEPEFSPKLAKQLAEGAGITTVTDLYDDSLGSTPELSSYEGMMRHNVDAIVQALTS
jgi:manganese/iron transport system substrate-binding protein